MKDNKFMKFWKKYGPYFLFGTGVAQFIAYKDYSVGTLFMILGLMLMTDHD